MFAATAAIQPRHPLTQDQTDALVQEMAFRQLRDRLKLPWLVRMVRRWLGL